MKERDGSHHPGQHRQSMGLWALVCFLGLWGFAGSSQALDVDVLIEQIQQTYEHTQALTADFVQVATLTSINRQQTSSGRVYIEKPYAIRWEYAQPDMQTILYDGKTLRIYTPRKRQLLQSVLDEDKRTNVALLFLAGIGNLRDAFTITPLPSPEERLAALRLLPRSLQAGFTELHIAVNTRSHFIEKLTIHDTIGNLTEIQLSTLEVHTDLPAQTFVLTVPPDTEILTPKDLSGHQ